jgi:hypothetical protein
MEALSEEKPQFKNLPRELRRQIWADTYAAMQPRITNIFTIVDRNSGMLIPGGKLDHLKHLIHSCQEARDVGYENIQLWTTAGRQARIHFNPKIETLWFDSLSKRHADLSIGLFQSQITSLAFSLECWTTIQKRILKSILLEFPNLQRLSIIIAPYFGRLHHYFNLAMVPLPLSVITLGLQKQLCLALSLKAEDITWATVQDAIQLDLGLMFVKVEILGLTTVEHEKYWRAHYKHQASTRNTKSLLSMMEIAYLRRGRCLSCSTSEDNEEDPVTLFSILQS